MTHHNFITETSTLNDCIGHTPLVKLARFAPQTDQGTATLFAKLEGNNPAGSVKDRPAYNMFYQAELRGTIKPGDTIIEATSGQYRHRPCHGRGNARLYAMTLIMPSNSTQERKDAMAAYGATLIEVDNMESARDLAQQMQAEGKGIVLDQFNNPTTNKRIIWPQVLRFGSKTNGTITHFISSITTGTIMGVSKYLKEQNPNVQIIGLQPAEGA